MYQGSLDSASQKQLKENLLQNPVAESSSSAAEAQPYRSNDRDSTETAAVEVTAIRPTASQILSFNLNFQKEWKLKNALFCTIFGNYFVNVILYMQILLPKELRAIGMATLATNTIINMTIGGFQADGHFMFNIDKFKDKQAPCIFWLMAMVEAQFQAFRFVAGIALGSEVAYATKLLSKYPDGLILYFYAFLAVMHTVFMSGYALSQTHEQLCHGCQNFFGNNTTSAHATITATASVVNPVGNNNSDNDPEAAIASDTSNDSSTPVATAIDAPLANTEPRLF